MREVSFDIPEEKEQTGNFRPIFAIIKTKKKASSIKFFFFVIVVIEFLS